MHFDLKETSTWSKIDVKITFSIFKLRRARNQMHDQMFFVFLGLVQLVDSQNPSLSYAHIGSIVEVLIELLVSLYKKTTLFRSVNSNSISPLFRPSEAV